MVAVQQTRGIFLFRPGHTAHHFTGEEWKSFYGGFVATGLVPIKIFDPGDVGAREFDLAANVYAS